MKSSLMMETMLSILQMFYSRIYTNKLMMMVIHIKCYRLLLIMTVMILLQSIRITGHMN